MSRLIGTNFDFNNQSKIVNLVNGSNPQDAVTFAQLSGAIEGLSTKDDVRAASTGNVSLTAPGTTLDGVTLVSGNRILLKDQSDQTQNGIWIWSGASSTLVRSADANANDELLGATTTVDEGSVNGGTTWRQTSVGITLGTTNILWTPFGVVSPPASTTTAGVAALATQAEVNAGTVTNKIVTPQTLAAYTGLPRKVSGTIGDGSATQFDIAHNLASQDVIVQVHQNSSPFATVEVDMEKISTTTVRIRFSVAPPSNSFRVVVIG